MTDPIKTTLILKSVEQANLTYIVEIEEVNGKHEYCNDENYYQALIVAKQLFDKLISNKDKVGDFGVMIESFQGRGVTYSVNEFLFDNNFSDTEDFYYDLYHEFEHEKVKKIDSNIIFRQLINKYKLNEYQEQQLLSLIKSKE